MSDGNRVLTGIKNGFVRGEKMKLASEIHRFYCSVHKAVFVWQSNRSAVRFEKGFVSCKFICARGLCRRQFAPFLLDIDNEYEFCHISLKLTKVT